MTRSSTPAARSLQHIRTELPTGSTKVVMAIEHALDTTPAVLLAHIPIDIPAPEGPLATGLPADLDQAELRAWVEGRTGGSITQGVKGVKFRPALTGWSILWSRAGANGGDGPLMRRPRKRLRQAIIE